MPPISVHSDPGHVTWKQFLVLGSLLLLNGLNGFTQTVEPFILNASGGNYVNRGSYNLANFSFVWSVGEATLIETYTTTDNSVILTNGVLQPITDKDLQTIPIQGWTREEIKLYPVPVNTLLQFDLYSNDTGRVEIQLYDLLGRTLGLREFQYNTLPVNQKIDFSKYASGPYFLRVSLYSKGFLKKSGVFKILKLR
ncbi:MAG: T9SS type A sorting domain-containing protein [Sphingobacteriia bacterium]|nr:T9SS type A sorting domain-containing protein [Sphingobacteriia bacterium]